MDHRCYYSNYQHYQPCKCGCVKKKISSNPPGTILRVHIPAGAVVSLLNIAEVCSPSGIDLLIRIPFLSGTSGFNNIINAVTGVGGTAYQMDPCHCREYFDQCDC